MIGLTLAATLLASRIAGTDAALTPRDAVEPWVLPPSASRCLTLAELAGAGIVPAADVYGGRCAAYVVAPAPPPAPRPVAAPRPPRTAPRPIPRPTLTPVAVAASQVGHSGPYAAGGFWCAAFVDWVMAQAHVPGFPVADGPAIMRTQAINQGRLRSTPAVGDIVFIDLHGVYGHVSSPTEVYVTHVGIVEAIDGTTLRTIEGNAPGSTTVVSRQTRHVGDGFAVDYATP